MIRRIAAAIERALVRAFGEPPVTDQQWARFCAAFNNEEPIK